MAQNIVRNGVIVEKEILRSAAGLDDVLSRVVDANQVPENPVGSGRYILEAGTILVTHTGNKVKPASADITGDGQTVVGILGVTKEFWLGSTNATNAHDEAVPVYHHGCHFDTTKLVNWSGGNPAAVKAALPTCKFT